MNILQPESVATAVELVRGRLDMLTFTMAEPVPTNVPGSPLGGSVGLVSITTVLKAIEDIQEVLDALQETFPISPPLKRKAQREVHLDPGRNRRRDPQSEREGSE